MEDLFIDAIKHLNNAVGILAQQSATIIGLETTYEIFKQLAAVEELIEQYQHKKESKNDN